MSIQAPPNLMVGRGIELIAAGINDWGGVSPVTPDHVNPEAPWPHLDDLARDTAKSGKTLVERLSIYPSYAHNAEKWLDKSFRAPVLSAIDSDGLVRTDDWTPGDASNVLPKLQSTEGFVANLELDLILTRATGGKGLTEVGGLSFVCGEGF